MYVDDSTQTWSPRFELKLLFWGLILIVMPFSVGMSSPSNAHQSSNAIKTTNTPSDGTRSPASTSSSVLSQTILAQTSVAQTSVAQTIDVQPPQLPEAEEPNPDLQELTPEEQERQALEQEIQQELLDFSASSETVTEVSEVVVIGQPAGFPYVVVVPGSYIRRLKRVQEIVPTAFITSSRRGTYIQAASFPSRGPANDLSERLRHFGFDAQVAYLPTD